MLQFIKKIFFSKKITKKESTDTGMAMVLLALLLGFFTHNDLFYKIALGLQIINMTFPGFFYPVAIIWLGLTTLLGEVVSKILLVFIYGLILVPVSLIRKLSGKDSLHLKKFRKDAGSVFVTRNHTFTLKDIEHPY
jgi:hypothetical protein